MFIFINVESKHLETKIMGSVYSLSQLGAIEGGMYKGEFCLLQRLSW